MLGANCAASVPVCRAKEGVDATGAPHRRERQSGTSLTDPGRHRLTKVLEHRELFDGNQPSGDAGAVTSMLRLASALGSSSREVIASFW